MSRTPKRRCDECHAWFTPMRPHQRFDTSTCRMLNWTAAHPRARIDTTSNAQDRRDFEDTERDDMERARLT